MEAPGENLLIKLWETLAEKGIGGILQPWQIRRVGQAQIDMRAREMIAIAQAEKEIEEIKAGNRNVALLPNGANSGSEEKVERREPTIDINGLIGSAHHIDHICGARREVNVAKAILKAEDELMNDSSKPSQEKVDEDWLFRWRSYAGDVSAEDLQSLWGKVLAGEVKRPGTFSPRTLEFLRGLSQKEAKEIELLSKYVVSGSIFRVDDKHIENAGLTTSFMLRMQELGLVSGVAALGLNISIRVSPNSPAALTSHGKVIFISHTQGELSISAPVYSGTSLLNEIIGIGRFEPDMEYLKKIGNHFKSTGANVALASYIPAGNDQIQMFGSTQL